MPVFDTRPSRNIEGWEFQGKLVVFDLEYTAWPGSKESGWSANNEYREIIQIGAVKIDAISFEEEARFDLLVSPARNPILSNYISTLTGISQASIDMEALPFPRAFSHFLNFVGDLPLLANGNDAAILRENCLLHDFVCPIPDERCLSAREWLKRSLSLDEESCVSGDLPRLLGLPETGQSHTGLADARAIVAAIRHVLGLGVEPPERH